MQKRTRAHEYYHCFLLIQDARMPEFKSRFHGMTVFILATYSYIVCECLHPAGKTLLVWLQPPVSVPPVARNYFDTSRRIDRYLRENGSFPVIEPAIVDVDVGVARGVVPIGHEQVGHLPKQPFAG